MAGRELKDGAQVLLRGSGGAPFRVTVGQPFTRAAIEQRLASGEWSWPDASPKAAAEESGRAPRKRVARKAAAKPQPGK